MFEEVDEKDEVEEAEGTTSLISSTDGLESFLLDLSLVIFVSHFGLEWSLFEMSFNAEAFRLFFFTGMTVEMELSSTE